MIIIVKDDEDVFTVHRKRQAGHKVDQYDVMKTHLLVIMMVMMMI